MRVNEQWAALLATTLAERPNERHVRRAVRLKKGLDRTPLGVLAFEAYHQLIDRLEGRV